GGVANKVVGAAGAKFAAIVVESERVNGIFGAIGFVERAGEELHEEHAAVGRPGEAFDGVGERAVAARELLAFENAFALAAGVDDPDVVVLEVEFLDLEALIHTECDTPIGPEGEGSDFIVDGLHRLVELRRRCRWRGGSGTRTSGSEERRCGKGKCKSGGDSSG